MTTVKMFKTLMNTKHFNKNQRVWVQTTTGDMACKVIGKFRGSGRYVSTWLRYTKKTKPRFLEFDVVQSFADRYNIKAY